MTPRLTPGAWLRRITDRWELGVTVLLDGVRINTTKQYLPAQWCHLEDDA